MPNCFLYASFVAGKTNLRIINNTVRSSQLCEREYNLEAIILSCWESLYCRKYGSLNEPRAFLKTRSFILEQRSKIVIYYVPPGVLCRTFTYYIGLATSCEAFVPTFRASKHSSSSKTPENSNNAENTIIYLWAIILNVRKYCIKAYSSRHQQMLFDREHRRVHWRSRPEVFSLCEIGSEN